MRSGNWLKSTRRARSPPPTAHNGIQHIMNRFLSSLRSRVLKNIELSRDLQVIEDYGDCKIRVGPGTFPTWRVADWVGKHCNSQG